jgi:hypothetical protein
VTRAPHYFIHGNLVFARGADDAWAGFRLEGESYPGLSLKRKLELKARLEAVAYAIEADFQLIRTAREWSGQDYVERALSTLDSRHADANRFRRYLDQQRARLDEHDALRPQIYLFVSLSSPPERPLGSRLTQMYREAALSLGLSDARGLSGKDLDALRDQERRAYERVDAFLPVDRARSGEVAHLIRSAYTRGLGEPTVDQNWRPQALWIDDANGAQFEPYQHDLVRLHESRLTIAARGLSVDSERGTSHQTVLVCGALAEEAMFPSAEVELMFAPLQCGFPVDAVFTCEWVANRSAQKLAQKRMVDADQQAAEEAFGAHGPSVRTSERTQAARELQGRVGASDRPPFLRSALFMALGAPSETELERRVERIRSEFGRTELHRPFGEQHRLFLAAMPAQRFPVRDYLAHLLPEQLGAMVPTAVSNAGSEIGPYIGHTLDPSQTPIQFDTGEASRQSRPPTVLLTGSLGSGKTIALELLLYQAFLQGSRPIVDVDPKGDHRLDALPGVLEEIEVIELGGGDRHRGLLDPMRIATESTREDLAYSFLIGLLPAPVPATWQTEIRAAVATAASNGARSLGAVLTELRHGAEGADEAASALEVHLEAGLARLAYAEDGDALPDVGTAQVVSLRIKDLVRPLPGTARSELSAEERVSQEILRLLAAYALRLCVADERTHSVLALDEAWALLSDTQGRALMDRLSRMGRSQNVTPILASQIIGDAAELEPLVGTYFAFGVETDDEAGRALELLRLDVDDEAVRQRLIGFRAGRCYFRDTAGRVVAMRVDPGPELLGDLDTTPRRGDERRSRMGANAAS